MRPGHRSFSGAIIALAGLPTLLGLLACIEMPMPVGDPEKSRIDPSLSGMWIAGGDIVYLEPYDKRSWLMTVIDIEFDSEYCGESETGDDEDADTDPVNLDDNVAVAAAIEKYGSECFEGGEVLLFKVWLTELGKRTFMTWEIKGVHWEDHGLNPAIWYAFRLDRRGADTLALHSLDLDHEAFAEVLELIDEWGSDQEVLDPRQRKKARRALEKVLRRRASDDELFELDFLEFQRVRPEDHEIFRAIAEDVVVYMQ